MLSLIIRLIFWSAAAFALIVASLPQPFGIPGSPGDKLQHITAFVVLSALAAQAYPRLPLPLLFLGLALFGGIIELVQSIPWLHRDADMHDWIADILATAATLSVIAGVRWLRKAVRRPRD